MIEERSNFYWRRPTRTRDVMLLVNNARNENENSRGHGHVEIIDYLAMEEIPQNLKRVCITV